MQDFVHVRILAQDAIKLENGVFELVLSGRPLTEQERELMRSLFPNLTEQAYDLLTKEAVFAALMD
jgi:hypothetical protein